MTTVTSDTDPAEAQRVMTDRQLLDLRTAIPGIVTAVSADGTTVDVQPAVSMTQRLESVNEVRLPVLQGVPLQVLGSTTLGLFVVVPVSIGDEGLLVVCDRAIDNWQHGAGVNMTPDMATPRHHDLTDAIFIPGVQRASGAIPGFPTDAVQLRNRAGDCVLALSDTAIDAVVPGGATFHMEGMEIVTNANITNTGTLTNTGDVSITGSLAQTGGTSTQSGGMNITGPLTNNGVNVGSTHVHGGVMAGGSNTAGPT